MVAIGGEFPFGRKFYHWPPLPAGRVAFDVFEDTRLQHKKGPIDPAFAVRWFFPKRADLRAIELEITEPAGGADRRYSGEFAVRAMKCKEARQIDIRQTVAPSQHECRIADMGRQPLDAAAGFGEWSSVDEMDDPVRFAAPFVDYHRTVARADG